MDNFARVNDDNIKGETPLHFAAKMGKLKHIIYIIKLISALWTLIKDQTQFRFEKSHFFQKVIEKSVNVLSETKPK